MSPDDAVLSASDGRLVADVLAGDRSAFEPLVKRYQAAIYNFAYRYTHDREEAADLTQETFLRAFRHLHRYNSSLPMRNWLYAIASNICRDWTRRRKARPVTAPWPDNGEEPPRGAAMQDDNPLDLLITAADVQALEAAIAELPDEYRVCFILFHLEGVSQADVAQILDLPLTVVKNRLYRARNRLRKRLTSQTPLCEGGEVYV